jgi:hypothetical protein
VRWAVRIAVLAMVAISAWQRWQILDATPYPVGVDGYFYPIEVRSLLEHGALAYPASPLTFWWMAPFALITDPIVGAKLGAAIGCALIGVPAYLAGKRLAGGCAAAGLVACALAVTSADSAYLSFEFVKQGIGLTVMLATVAAIAGDRRWAAIACGAVATLLAHKLAFVLLVILGGPMLVVRVRARLFGRRLLYALVGAVVAAIALAIVGLAIPKRLPSLDDVALVRGLFGRARWDLPALVAPHVTLAFRHEALAAGVLCIAAAFVVRRERDPMQRAFGWSVVALGVAIALPWLDVADPQGLGFRLRIVAFVPLALAAAIVTREIAVPRKGALLAIAAAALFVIGAARRLTEGEVVMHPALAAATANAAGKIPPGATVIVPERRILFPIEWYTRAPVSLRPEHVPIAQRVRIFGLTWAGGDGSPLDRALDAARLDPSVAPPISLHAGHRNGLVIVTEPTWDWLLDHLPADARAHYARWPTL